MESGRARWRWHALRNCAGAPESMSVCATLGLARGLDRAETYHAGERVVHHPESRQRRLSLVRRVRSAPMRRAEPGSHLLEPRAESVRRRWIDGFRIIIRRRESIGEYVVFQTCLNTECALTYGGHANFWRENFADAIAPAEAVESGFGKEDSIVFATCDFAQAGVHVARKSRTSRSGRAWSTCEVRRRLLVPIRAPLRRVDSVSFFAATRQSRVSSRRQIAGKQRREGTSVGISFTL